MRTKNEKAAHNMLYIAFMFPPLAGPASRHNLSTIRGLLARGFSPTVITAPEEVGTVRAGSQSFTLRARQWPQDEYLRSLIPDGVTVLRCAWPLEYQRIVAVVSNQLRLTSLAYFFGRGRRRMHDVAQKALETGDYELIYSVNGVGVEHMTALELKRSTGLPWVAEFRDPWIYNRLEWQSIRDHSWHWWCARQYRRVRDLLHQVVDNADLVVVESPLHAEYLIRDFNLDAQKAVALGMGFETAYATGVADGLVAFPRRPAIGFIGSTYYGYKPAVKNLIDAFKVLELRGYAFTLVSVGTDPTFRAFANEANLRSFVPISGVNHSVALSMTNELDFGIVVTCKACMPHINSKLWDYLALGLSILAIAPEGGSMDSIIKAGNCGYVLPYDVDSMLPALEAALRDYENANVRHASPEFVQSYSRQTLIAQLVNKIEALI